MRPYASSTQLIVVDDGSDDETSQVAARAASGDDRLHLIRFPENRGQEKVGAFGLDLRLYLDAGRDRWPGRGSCQE
jgi:glycosyltransferase involved in cell wall biosynthesis